MQAGEKTDSKNVGFKAKFYSFLVNVCVQRWVSGGGVGVPCTVNPLHDGLTAEDEASKAAETFHLRNRDYPSLGAGGR